MARTAPKVGVPCISAGVGSQQRRLSCGSCLPKIDIGLTSQSRDEVRDFPPSAVQWIVIHLHSRVWILSSTSGGSTQVP